VVALYVTSWQGGAGKTAICAGLGKHLLSDGKKVGFFKPIVADIKSPPIGAIDSDTAFIKDVFTLEEPVSNLCPVINGHNTVANRIKEAYTGVSQGKDVVIVEGIWRQRPGGKLIEASYEVVEALDARVIIVEGYPKGLSEAELIDRSKEFGDYLLGVVLNKVPENKLEHICSELSAQLGQAGVNLLGVLPEDKVLFTLTVGDLAEHLQGEILNCTEKSAEPVENFMLGATGVDPGPDYFSRKINKAVVLRGERPDMQLAALRTSTRCLILSGDVAPIPAVLYQAEDKKVPIISAKGDVTTVAAAIEDALSQTKFNYEKKLPRLTELIEQHFDFPALYQGLGLAD